MTKLYDLCVSTREYTDNSGNKKSVWENIGSILQNDDGKNFIMLKAHFNPAAIKRKEGSESILVSMFMPKDTTADYSSFNQSASNNRKLYDLCVATREYFREGNKRSVWENIGAIIAGDNNPFMMLKAHFNPAAITRKEGSECILVSMFAPKEKDNSGYGSGTDNYSADNGNSTYSTTDTYGYGSDIDSSPAPTAYNPEIPF